MMAKNKAFIRYANNKAVPGSLIVRKKAPSVGVWKEVNYDLCCDTQNKEECNEKVNLYLAYEDIGPSIIPVGVAIKFNCGASQVFFYKINFPFEYAATLEEIAIVLNEQFPFGTFSVVIFPETGNPIIQLALCKDFADRICFWSTLTVQPQY